MQFPSEKKNVPGEGSEGAAYQQLAAAKTLPSEFSGGEQRRLAPKEVCRFLTLAWLRDQGQTLATWLPKHVTADPAAALGFSREIELHRLPETRSADRRQLSITLPIR